MHETMTTIPRYFWQCDTNLARMLLEHGADPQDNMEHREGNVDMETTRLVTPHCSPHPADRTTPPTLGVGCDDDESSSKAQDNDNDMMAGIHGTRPETGPPERPRGSGP